jgi:alkanesulfonate monooxygenase SsuD/methylene tetrahydromethanopterin reductase-like flavin-dependent oxidoreductase (luciferase family)
MTTIGAVFPPSQPPERLRDVARAAEAAGLDELWLWEDCFREGGVATSATALASTERLRVGVGVFPVPLRNVALAAMEFASLERMFPGRAIIGIGHGVQSWMAQVGARPASPLTLLREYAIALRALLAGERLTVDGRYVHLDDVALDWPPRSAPLVHAAASGPRTLRLVGEVADGTVLTSGSTADDVRTAVSLAAEGRAAAGRAVDGRAIDGRPTDGSATDEVTGHHHITVYLAVATGPNAAERLAADAAYYGVPDLYSVAGDAADIAAAARELADAGADSIVLQPTTDDDDLEAFVRFAATEIAPLVK